MWEFTEKLKTAPMRLVIVVGLPIAIVAAIFAHRYLNRDYLGGLAYRMPDGTLAVFWLNRLDDPMNALGGGMDAFFREVERVSGGGETDYEAVKRNVMQAFGFDPLNPESWELHGVDPTRPIAVAVPGLSMDVSPEAIAFIPIEDRDDFEEFLVAFVKNMARQTGYSESPTVAIESAGRRIKKISLNGKPALFFDYVWGYARISPDRSTLQWTSQKTMRERLPFVAEFKKAVAGAPEDPAYWLYINPKLVDAARRGIEGAAGVKPDVLKQWFGSARGYLFASAQDGEVVVNHTSIPSPNNENFVETIEPGEGFVASMKHLPDDPIFLWKGPFHPRGFVRALLNLAAIHPMIRSGADQALQSLDESLGVDVTGELLTAFGSGVLVAVYPPSGVETTAPRFVALLSAPKQKNLDETLAKMIPGLSTMIGGEITEEGNGRYSFHPIADGSATVSFGVRDEIFYISNDPELSSGVLDGKKVPTSFYDRLDEVGYGGELDDPATALIFTDAELGRLMQEIPTGDARPFDPAILDRLIGRGGNSITVVKNIEEGLVVKSYNESDKAPLTTAMISLAIIAPDALSFYGKMKQSEARNNLYDLMSMSMVGYMNSGGESVGFSQINWKPGDHRYYTFYLSCEEKLDPPGGGVEECPPEISAFFGASCYSEYLCPRAAAAGNIDLDPTLDVWVIDEQGSMANIVNDVEE